MLPVHNTAVKRIEHAMPNTPHANGEPLLIFHILSSLQRFCSGPQTAMVGNALTSKASSNLLNDDTYRAFLRVIVSSIRTNRAR